MKLIIKPFIITVSFCFMVLLTSCKKEILLSKKAEFMQKKEFKYFGVSVDSVYGSAGVSMYTGNIFGIDYNGNVKTLLNDTENVHEIRICMGKPNELLVIVRTVTEDLILKKYDLANKTVIKEFKLNKNSIIQFNRIFFNPNDNFVYVMALNRVVRINAESGTEELVINKSVVNLVLDVDGNYGYYSYSDSFYKYHFNSNTSEFLMLIPTNTGANQIFYNQEDKKIFAEGNWKIRAVDLVNKEFSAPLYHLPFNAGVGSGDFLVKGDKVTFRRHDFRDYLYVFDLKNFIEEPFLLKSLSKGSYLNEYTHSNY